MVRRVVRRVVVFIVGGMNTSDRLEVTFRRIRPQLLPPTWDSDLPGWSERTLGELVEAIRVLGRDSDALVRGLVAVDDERELATFVLLDALMPLLLRYASSDARIVEDLVTELVLVIADARVGFGPNSRRLGGVLADRAYDRFRWETQRRETHELLTEPRHLVWERPAAVPGPEEVVAGCVRLSDVRRALNRPDPLGRQLVRAWDVAVALGERAMARPSLQGNEKQHWHYAIRRLREHGLPEQVA